MSVTVSPSSSTTCKRINVRWSTTTSGINGMSVDRTDNNGQSSNALPPIASPKSPWPDTGMTCGVSYTYTVTLYKNGHQVDQGTASFTVSASCCRRPTSSAFIQIRRGQFEMLVPRGGVVNDYTHTKGTILKQNWKHVRTIMLTSDDPQSQVKAISVSLIQSASGKLEAIVRVSPSPSEGSSDYLVAYELDRESDWQGPVKLVADTGPINAVTGTPALIQSDYDNLNKFELLVPRVDGERAVIDHYIREKGTILEGPWTQVATLRLPEGDPQSQVKAVSLLQSVSGKLEALARVSSSTEGKASNDYLVGYEFDPASGWQGPVALVTDDGPINAVTGMSALIQSSYDDLDKFELLVPRATSEGAVLDHYIHERGTIVKGPWKLAHTLKLPEDDPRSLAKAVWLLQSISGPLEAVARISPSSGGTDYLVGYEFDLASGWQGPVKLVANDGPILIGDTPGEQTPPPIG